MDLRIVAVHPKAILPRYASAGAAGLDLCAALEASLAVPPLGRVRVPTGLVLAIPEGYEGQVRPRSGLAFKHGLTVLNAPGTIDSDFRGELQVLLVNLGTDTVSIAPGERIAQLVIAAYVRAEPVWVGDVSELGNTARGAGGFGSTGNR
jgi:dUTP pyrophosphatase